MANLTQDQKLVRYIPGIDPIAGHYLVFFKKVGEGRKLRCWLNPGEKLKKSFLESADSFVAYAVPADPNLRYRFSGEYKTHDQVRKFGLAFSLEYRVENPAVLVEKVDSDPLQRLVEEIQQVLIQATKSLRWADIEHEVVDLEQRIFDELMSNGEVQISNGEKIRRFAVQLGFEVRRIGVARTLPDDEVRDSLALKKADQDRRIVAAEHVVQDLGSELKQRTDLRLLEQAQAVERRGRLQDTLANVVIRDIDSATSITEAVRKAEALQSSSLGFLGHRAEPERDQLVGSVPHRGLGSLHAAPDDAEADGSKGIILEIWRQFERAPSDNARRLSILSHALHLVAESVLGPDADAAELQRRATGLRNLIRELLAADALGSDQVRLLEKLARAGEPQPARRGEARSES